MGSAASSTTSSSIVGGPFITRQALGRTAHLGDLYDARTDTFCSKSILKKQLPTNSPAIETTVNKRSNRHYIESDSLEEKMSKLDVDLQLKLSILAGLVIPGGSAKYLKERKQSSKSVEKAVVYDITTVTEKLDISSKQIQKYLEPQNELTSACANATHVVVQIDWGAKCFIIVTDHNQEDDEKERVGWNPSAKLEKLNASGEKGAEFEQDERHNWNNLSLEIFGDVLLDGCDDCPTTVDGAVRLITKHVRECNGGKGTPVTFHMRPLLTVPYQEVPDKEVLRVDCLFSRIDELKQRAYDFNFKEDREALQRCEEIVIEINSLENDMRCAIKKCVSDIRSAKCDSELLTEICEEYEKNVDEITQELEEMRSQMLFPLSSVLGIPKITRQALGREAELGDLYNAIKDEFCSTSIFKEQLPTNSPAIKTKNKKQSNTHYIESDSLEEKMSKLDVDLQLKLSILAGIVTLGGSAKYLKESKRSYKSAERSLMYDITTVTEKLIPESKETEGLIKKPNALASTGATHVVVQIDWGAKCFVSVTDHNHGNAKKTVVGGKISAELEKFKLVSGEAGAEFGRGEKDEWSKLSLNIFGDVLLDAVPTNVDEVVELIRKMPERVMECSGGKGKPVTFHMLPLLSQTVPIEVPDRAVLRVNCLFSRIDELKQRAYDFNFKEDREALQRCEEIVIKINSLENDVRCAIKKCVLDIRSAKCDSELLTEICEEYEGKVEKMERVIRGLEKTTRQKMEMRLRRQEALEKTKKEKDVPQEVPQQSVRQWAMSYVSSICLLM